MANQTAASLATSSMDLSTLTLSPGDGSLLRRLAGRVAELAARPGEAVKRERWIRHNDLDAGLPLIFCDPENGWNEIVTDDQMECQGELARRWEMALRKEVFWGESMGDDRVVEPYFNVGHVYAESDWGMHEKKVGGDHGGSYAWDAPLKSYDVFDKLRFPTITVDYKASDALLQTASDCLGDILKVRRRTSWWWTLGMTWTLANIRGLEQIMIDMYDEPENLKRIMDFLSRGHLAKLDFLEKNGLLFSNANDSYVGSGGFGYTRQLPQGKTPITTRDMWGFCESQETTSVSPDMFAEFIWPYQKPIMERFGLGCYGCCEPLDQRWQYIKDVPGLRRISVSPWANPEVMGEHLGSGFIFSSKPNPAHLAVPNLHEVEVREELRKILTAAHRHGCRLELIMKDNHTLGGNPLNAVNWCRMAREEIRNIWE